MFKILIENQSFMLYCVKLPKNQKISLNQFLFKTDVWKTKLKHSSILVVEYRLHIYVSLML